MCIRDRDKLSPDVSIYKKSEIRRTGRKKNSKKREDDDLSILPEEVKSLLGD